MLLPPLEKLHIWGLTRELTRRRPTALGSELADLGGRVE